MTSIVGKNPGYTKSISSKIKVLDSTLLTSDANPNLRVLYLLLRKLDIKLQVFMMDCPGLIPPYIPDFSVALKLALINSLPNKDQSVNLVFEYLMWKASDADV